MDLDDLLRGFVVKGDGAAMEELVARTRPRLLRVARRIGAPQDADDAVQAAYLALVRRAARPLDAPVLAWLLTAVLRIAYRNKAVAKRRVEAARRLADWTGEETPLDRTIRKDEIVAIRREVTRLPATYRDALVLHHLEGLPVEEVAALLDVTPSAVKMRLLRGRALLRSRLGIRLGYSVLWLPWALADARAATLGGLAMKKLALAAGLALALATTFFVMQRRPHPTPLGRAEARVVPVAPTGETAPAEVPANDAAEPDAQTGDPLISGRVTDESGAPVAGVGVFVRQYDEIIPGMRGTPPFYPYEVEPEARTDGDGRFAIAGPIERLNSVWLIKGGWAAVEREMIEGLGHPAPTTGLEVVLKPGHAAAGAVYDTEGRPVPGARVWFDGITVHADERGRYTFDMLKAPPWHRLVSAPGYEQIADAFRKGGGEGDFRLRRNSLIVEAASRVTGASLPEARGVLVRAGTGERTAALVPTFGPGMPDVVFPPGRIYPERMPDLAGGGRAEFDVHVFEPGYVPSTTRIALTPGEEPPHLRVELERGSAEPMLSGHVLGALSATIEIREADGPGSTRGDDVRPLLATVATGEGGSFGVAGLPKGTYRMIVRAKRMGVVARDITVPAHEVTIRLEPAATLVVRGTGADGKPIAGAWIHAESADGSVIREVRTEKDGRATFDDLPGGRLLVCPACLHGCSVRLWNVPFDEFDVAPGVAVERTIEVPIEQEFTLEVADGRGEPVAGAVVTVRPRAGYGLVLLGRPSREASTDARGKAVFALYPGTYDATVAHDGATDTSGFEAPANGSHRLLIGKAPVLRGRVVDAKSGAPVHDIQVGLVGEDMRGQALTDHEGGFVIACNAHGIVKLHIVPLNGPEGKQWSGTPYPFFVLRDLDGGALPPDPLVVALPKVRGAEADVPVSVEVTSTDAAAGTPVDGARIFVGVLRGAFWMWSGDQVVSGEGGRATCNVARGESYQIRVSGPEGAVVYEPLTIEREGGSDEIRVAAPLARR